MTVGVSTIALRHETDSLCPPSLRRAIRRKLLTWYDRHSRDLPWRRRQGDPYAQWIAEIMLQQTRVETVLDYYERFLRRFPTVASLARAKEETVLKLWEGLGYYRRVQNLRKACILLCETGQPIPQSAEQLRQLPGVGAYTAAAISSIAFGCNEAAVDGNVARVIARLFERSHDIASAKGRHEIQRLATRLLSRSRPGDFNQAWMDLGSSICTPRKPACDRCPLRSNCRAAQNGTVEEYPVRDTSRINRVQEVNLIVGIFLRAGKMLVRRRPPGGIWSSLWEFPNLECGNGSTPNGRSLRRLARSEGLTVTGKPTRVGVTQHRLTHRLMRFDIRVADVEVSQDPTRVASRGEAPRRWVNERSLMRLSMPTGFRRVHERAKTEIERVR